MTPLPSALTEYVPLMVPELTVGGALGKDAVTLVETALTLPAPSNVITPKIADWEELASDVHLLSKKL